MMLAKLLVSLATIAGMANEEHLRVVLEGAEAIRVWRRSNPGVRLDLTGANLFKVNLRNADLSNAILTGSFLMEASLNDASMLNASLDGAVLVKANLTGANLCGAILDNAVLFRAILNRTDLGALDLSVVKPIELGSLNHMGPSNLATNTLVKSRGRIHEEFLRGCGLSNWEIEATRLWLDLSRQDLARISNRLLDLRVPLDVRFHPAFLSHSHQDKAFVKKLYDALQAAGVRCWLDEKQLVPGEHLHDAIDRGVTAFDKFVLVCSKSSLAPDNSWVKREMRIAFKKEEKLAKQFGEPICVLVPIMIDDYALDRWSGDGMDSEVKSRVIGDFRNHEDDDAFKASLELLIKALRADAGGGEPDPQSLFGMHCRLEEVQ